MHLLCKPWVQASAELPGRAIALLPPPLGAAHVKKGLLTLCGMGFYPGAQSRAGCKLESLRGFQKSNL
eukprot:123090-Pelagomonas_calceolata.AAC.5